MKRGLLYLSAVLCMILSLILSITSPDPILAATSHVYPGESIQDAINASSSGDTIIVHDGTYNENIFIDKPLTILSDNGSAVTIIDGTSGGANPTVGIISSNVTFGNTSHGFTITNRFTSEAGSGMGLFVMNTGNGVMSDITIRGNYIYDVGGGINGNGPGIVLGNMGTGIICGNNLSGNEVYNCNMGVALVNMNASDIHGNTISGNAVHHVAIPIPLFNFVPGGQIYENDIRGNEVYEDSGFCIILSGYGGDIYGNLIASNIVHDSFVGIILGEVAGFDGVHVYDNVVRDNEVFNCGAGIALGIEGTGEVYGNTVQDNSTHDMTPKESTTGTGIALGIMGSGNVTANTIDGNTAYNCTIGIQAKTIAGSTGAITDNTISSNIVYDCPQAINIDQSGGANNNNDILHNITYNDSSGVGNEYGILLARCDNISVIGNDIAFSSQAGLAIAGCDYTNVTGNAIHNNSHGIYTLYGSSFIYIYGNDIRDNGGVTTGLLLNSSNQIYVRCNNFKNNGCGVLNMGSTNVYVDHNWWGDTCGPGCGASDDICGDDVEGEEIYLSQENILNTAAVPSTIPLGDNYSTLLKVEQQTEEGCCNASSVAVDFGAILLDLLPADFTQRYVSTWTVEAQADWTDWLNSLNDIDMSYNESEAAWKYEFDMEELLIDGLMPFFAYYGGDEDYAGLINEKLRLGNHYVPVDIYSNVCGLNCTAFILLTITIPTPVPTPTPPPLPSPTPTLTTYYNPAPMPTVEKTPEATPTAIVTPIASMTPSASPTPFTSTPQPTSTGTPGLTTTPAGQSSLNVSFWDNESSGQVSISTNGTLLADISAFSQDGTATAKIAAGTQITNPSGQPVGDITIEKITGDLSVPNDYFLIQAYDFGPDGTVFSSALQMSIKYDLSQLPEGQQPVIAYYDKDTGEWTFLIGEVDTYAGIITFSIAHFSTYALIGQSAASDEHREGFAPWVWIVIGLIDMLCLVLGIGLWMRRRTAPINSRSRSRSD